MWVKKNIYFNNVTIVGFVNIWFVWFTDNEEKVRDHCDVTGKVSGATHWSCNINLQLTKKVPIMFQNLKGYDSDLIFCELKNFHVKISVIPNGLEK